VVVVVDTLRRDALGVYGASRSTPAIDGIAARGRVYRHFAASFHQTSMSMGALFTGRVPSIESGDPARPLPWTGQTWCGMSRLAKAGDAHCVPESLPTLAEAMRDAGYWTIGIASNDFLHANSGYDRGFDDWVQVGLLAPGGSPSAPRAASRARRWERVHEAIVVALARRPRERLFLYVHYMDAHDWTIAGTDYASAVARADAGVGALLEHLEATGLAAGAVVILTSDHGERIAETHPPFFKPKPGHLGNPSFQELLEIPLIIAPDVGPESDVPRRSHDLFHEIRALAGLEPTTNTELESDELFLGELHTRTYRRGRWKSAMSRRGGVPLLFDLATDPGEQRNVAAEHPDVVAAHRARMDGLTAALATTRATRADLEPDERKRLRALGYLEED